MTLGLIVGGIFSMQKLPIDAVPDITNNQVQIVTASSSLAPQEVEQFITFPVEMAMANIPSVVEIRSISRFGLSVVTVVFEEHVEIMRARQFVKEQLDVARNEIPAELGNPEMMPITTGLGEIYQYTLQVDSAFQDHYSSMELRSIQDWIVKRQLMGIDGIIEVSSFGGYLKQYEVSVDPFLLQAHNVTVLDVFDALEKNNQNSGGSYIEKGPNAYYIRTEGLVKSLEDIEQIVIKKDNESPVLVRNVATVTFGHPPRFGAMTMDGKGETVGGITLMLKGSNSSEAIDNVHQRIAQVQKSLPPGVHIEPYLDRSVLVGKAIGTVSKNLIEGGLIVVFVLILFLGNFRAGLIVASVIPLSLLIAFILMHLFGVSANLMSLGAIDFGIVIDGAVIIVEGVLHLIYANYIGKKLNQQEMDGIIVKSASSIIGSAAFGVLIIIVVFIPIMTLTGIEGKMFNPMAKTVSFAILGALILSITYVPMMSALFLKKNIKETNTLADRMVNWLRNKYAPVLRKALQIPSFIIGGALGLLVLSFFLFGRMGAEFIPTLDEGDMAMQATIEPGSSLTQMIHTTTEAEKILLVHFPEVKHVVSKIGTAEIPTDPMAVEDADIMILLKEKDEWVSAHSREELASLMKEKLKQVHWAQFDFTQPIQLRFNELISGSKTDVAIKLFGEDLEELASQGEKIASIVEKVQGAGDVKIEQTEGLPQLMIRFNREKLALYHLDIEELNRIVRSAYAGENAGIVYEGEKRFDLTVRLNENHRENLELNALFVNTPDGRSIPLSEVAEIAIQDGPIQISRENANRRIAVGVNVRDRDIASFVEEVQQKLDTQIDLKPGYFIQYGGQFENLEAAKRQLGIAVPVALALIFLLLFFAFKSVKYALLIYVTVPLSAIGGILALLVRDMPFSISAGVGFIALFGVAVLNGIVLISYFNRLKEEGEEDIRALVIKGSEVRLRPVLMTAAVASLGFLPMAISSSAGAEVQKPLATVVIGGLITATLLTLLVLPVMYYLTERKKRKTNGRLVTIALFVLVSTSTQAQTLTEEMAIDSVLKNHLGFTNAHLEIEQAKLDRKAAFRLGNTSGAYQYGQMNSLARDHYWEVEQSLGNPLHQIQTARVADALTEVKTGQMLRMRKELVYQTRSLWYNWVYFNQNVRLLEHQVELLDTYIQIMRKKQEVGEVSSIDVGLIELYRSELLTRLAAAKMETLGVKASLIQLGNFTIDISLPEADSLRVVVDAFQLMDSTIDSDLLTANEAAVVQSEAQIRQERANYFPEISAGYFQQSLDNVAGFQGMKLGISIPLINRTHSANIKKAQLQKIIYENEWRQRTIELESNYQRSREQLEVYLNLYAEHHDYWLEQVNWIQTAVRKSFELGNIDYYRFVQTQSQILEIESRRIELINQINQTFFEVEYYTSHSKFN